MYKNNIKELCQQQDISVNQLALKAGIASSTVYQVANGKICPFPKWKRLISKVLNVSEEEVFPDKSYRKECCG